MEALKKLASKTVIGNMGSGKPKGYFERLMNRLGWYRKSEWYVIENSKLMRSFGSIFVEPKEE